MLEGISYEFARVLMKSGYSVSRGVWENTEDYVEYVADSAELSLPYFKRTTDGVSRVYQASVADQEADDWFIVVEEDDEETEAADASEDVVEVDPGVADEANELPA